MATNMYKKLTFLCTLLALASCTHVKYTDSTHALTITDIRITGSAIDLEATLNEIGSLRVNREQGSALDGVSTVVEAVSP
jgi:hypothetical protein